MGLGLAMVVIDVLQVGGCIRVRDEHVSFRL